MPGHGVPQSVDRSGLLAFSWRARTRNPVRRSPRPATDRERLGNAFAPTFVLVFIAEILHGITGGIVKPAIAAISLGQF
jgi:hypothetical protein